VINLDLSIQIFILIFLLLTSAFFSIAETSLMSINRIRLNTLKNNGHRSALLTYKLLQQTDKLLSVILICNNLSNAAAASLVTVITFQLFQNNDFILLLSTLSVTFLIVVFSEISPKVIAAANPEKIGLFCSYILYPLLKLMYPIVFIINLFVLAVLKLFNIKLNFSNKNLITMEDLRTVISESSSYLHQKNQSIFMNLINIEQDTVDDAMTPHTQTESININSPADEIVEKIKNFHHQNVIVRDENNSIIGILEINKLIQYLNLKEEITIENIKGIITEPIFIASGTSMLKQLQSFQDKKNKISLIVNEHGEFIGLITLEDILEEIIGDFKLTLPTEDSKIIDDEDGWIVEGGISLKKLNKQLSITLEAKNSKTLNGLILEYFETIPETDTSFKLQEITMEIINSQEKNIKTVKIYK
jgi:Mg2+/Co2+ transporter CorB